MRAEGFTVPDVPPSAMTLLSLARGEYDLCFSFASQAVMGLEAHLPITILGGVHIGCFELFGNERIRAITDLKNRTVGIRGEGLRKDLVTIIASYIGLDPVKDIRWVNDPEPMELFAAGKIDAFVALPPETLELRARNIGHVIMNSSVDRPWSQYFCCMLDGQQRFRPQASGRDEALAKGGSQGHRSLCIRTKAGRAVDGGAGIRGSL